ncbi:biotin-dependent carboxyltransferase family protein [Ferrimonas pelagia]|uniref:Biotin-dependent carboxyltransferase family protein n=1 Tax=Ferrimonas pelagia TaxID=1177826 RepID=A0ABP9EXS6_9GAMM
MLDVIKPGLLTTVQDLGRTGMAAMGFSRSGAMDPLAASAANLLLDQPANTPLLECTLLGPQLRFDCDSVFALSGAIMDAELDGEAVTVGQAITVQAGQTLKLGRARIGCRCYLAIKGGLKVAAVLGSVSTQLNSQIGGWHGRALRAGDRLPIAASDRSAPGYCASWLGLATESPDQIKTVAALPQLAAEDHPLYQSEWRIDPRSDRMGFRLDGSPLANANASNDGLSEPVQAGTIQLPRGGQPIVLMADSQPTGGYNQLAQIAAADLPLLAQLAPGQSLRLVCCKLDQAQRMLAEQQYRLQRLAFAARRCWNTTATTR